VFLWRVGGSRAIMVIISSAKVPNGVRRMQVVRSFMRACARESRCECSPCRSDNILKVHSRKRSKKTNALCRFTSPHARWWSTLCTHHKGRRGREPPTSSSCVASTNRFSRSCRSSLALASRNSSSAWCGCADVWVCRGCVRERECARTAAVRVLEERQG
jgi:hypothetical protein